MIKQVIFIFIIILFLLSQFGCKKEENFQLHLAVEFTAHAAAPHIARAKHWFKLEGLNIKTYDNYITGMALASALSRGDIDAAYICLIPAILAYKNGGVKLKVVCGTHLYGYGLVVNPKKIKQIEDLLKPEIKIACTREGSPTDALMNKMIEKCGFKKEIFEKKVLRMPPPKALLLLKTGQIDAAWCCEQFPSMAVEAGFKELFSAKDLWHEMQGSVLVVKEDLIKHHPDIVRKLVKITQKATKYLHEHPDEASKIVAQQLTIAGKSVFPIKVSKIGKKFKVTPSAIKRALFSRLNCTTEINPKIVQQEIDYMYELGYIKEKFKAQEILDLRFLK